MGRLPKSNKQKAAESSWQGRDRHGHPIVGTDFKPDVEIPERPKGLGYSGRREFALITRMLAEKGTISKLDKAAISAYCEAFEGAEESKRLIKKHGQLVPVYFIDKISGMPVLDAEGHPQVKEWRNNPAVHNHGMYLSLMGKYLDMFGMSPKSRQALKIPEKPKENALDALMKKPVLGFQNTGVAEPRRFTQPAAPAVNVTPDEPLKI